jgi:hypothetical protein
LASLYLSVSLTLSLSVCLSLGVIIPVHHDTGHWVKHTHRVHVPIITGPELEFLVGPNDQSMQSYDVSEGRIIELNNQAKHAVTNNLSFYRVHLIFDYVEDFPITRYTLQPGQILHQTRRSIDFDPNDPNLDPSFLDAQQPQPFPSFIILGTPPASLPSVPYLPFTHSFLSSHAFQVHKSVAPPLSMNTSLNIPSS